MGLPSVLQGKVPAGLGKDRMITGLKQAGRLIDVWVRFRWIRLTILLCTRRGFVFNMTTTLTEKDDSMIKHMVMWKFKDEVTEADKLEMKRQLESLKGVVPSLLDIEVGMDVVGTPASKDMVLTTLFHSLSDLQAYADHPAHVAVVEFVKPLVAERALVDYEC